MNRSIKKIMHGVSRRIWGVAKYLEFILDFKKNKHIVFTKTPANGLRIHLGAGLVNLQGWINIDARELSHIHLVTDKLNMSEFSEESITEIYTCHLLEHLSFEEADHAIENFYNKLKKGGILRVSVPNFEAIIEIYRNNNNLESIKFALMGGQDYPYNFHKSVYDRGELEKLFKKHGFVAVEEWATFEDFGVDIGDWSCVSFCTTKGNIPISLNLKALKP